MTLMEAVLRTTPKRRSISANEKSRICSPFIKFDCSKTILCLMVYVANVFIRLHNARHIILVGSVDVALVGILRLFYNGCIGNVVNLSLWAVCSFGKNRWCIWGRWWHEVSAASSIRAVSLRLCQGWLIDANRDQTGSYQSSRENKTKL